MNPRSQPSESICLIYERERESEREAIVNDFFLSLENPQNKTHTFQSLLIKRNPCRGILEKSKEALKDNLLIQFPFMPISSLCTGQGAGNMHYTWKLQTWVDAAEMSLA